jgi:hypothetical protein
MKYKQIVLIAFLVPILGFGYLHDSSKFDSSTAFISNNNSARLFIIPGTNWGAWANFRGWKGLDYRVMCEGGDGPQYVWWVQFYNRYSMTINLDFRVADRNVTSPQFTDRLTIQPGQSDQGWNLCYTTPRGEVNVWIDHVRFGNDDTGPYANRDE